MFSTVSPNTASLPDVAAPRAAVPEPVRLVIWDLDETFWKGTLTEGGITEYVRENHDLVIELARRGIISSICSKNDADAVSAILKEKGIADYFVFPSISWDPKGIRIASLIEAAQLRAPTVMFIDDNPNNLAEARAVVPGIQVEGADFVGRMLQDPRFKGKDDCTLTRLAQYKLLETRKRDEAQCSGDNTAFLRSCDVRVCIEHDVFGHLDRAIELINRTNQLNFTKNRLPEDPERARDKLRKQCTGSHRQAGLVRVVDKYGDYGYVGFYLLRNRRSDPAPGLANQTLVHYCFSCRTLGMFVEKWLYDQLRCPALEVVGDVLTDLSVVRDIDWIRMVPSISAEGGSATQIAPEIRISGGCEANSVGHYLGAYCGRAEVTGNFQAGALFVRLNSCHLLLSAVDHAGPLLERELDQLGISAPLTGTNYFRNASEGTLFVFSGGMDAFGGAHRIKHRKHGWELHVTTGESSDFVSLSDEEAAQIIADRRNEAEKRQLEFAIRHIRENYEIAGADDELTLLRSMENVVRHVPRSCRLIFLLDDERRRSKRGAIRIKPQRVRYNDWVRSFAAKYPFVGTASFADAIESEDEILSGGNHYARMVYWRVAEQVVAVAQALTPKREAAPQGDRAEEDGTVVVPRTVVGSRETGQSPPEPERLLTGS